MKLGHKKGFYIVDFRVQVPCPECRGADSKKALCARCDGAGAVNGARKRTSTGIRIPADTKARGRAEAQALEIAAELVKKANGEAAERPEEKRGAYSLKEALDYTYLTHWSHLAYGVTMGPVVNKLGREIGHMPLAKVTYDWLSGWCEEWRKEGKAVGTLNRRMSAVGKAMRVALKRKDKTGYTGPLPDFPHFTEQEYTRERYMEDHEETEALKWFERMAINDEAEKRENWVYMKHLCVFLLDSGFRFSEAFKFTLIGESADLAHGGTKNTIGRRIPLTHRALEAARYLLQSPIHRELDLSTTKLRPKASWDWCDHRFSRCMLEIGANRKDTPRNGRLTMHGMRHTCASRLVQRRRDLYEVQKWMGHKSIKVTQRYAKLKPDQFLGARDVLQSPPAPRAPPSDMQGALLRKMLGLQPNDPLPGDDALRALVEPQAHMETLHGTRTSHEWEQSMGVPREEKE